MSGEAMKIGVIGAGAISKSYIETIQKKFSILHLTKICARHIENARRTAEAYGLVPCTMEEMLLDQEIQAVLNLTSAPAHYETVKAALDAGKHVYVEKPLANSPAEARELAELAAQKGSYLCSAPDTFLGASVQTARRAIDEDRIGDVTSFVIAANRDNNVLLSLFPNLRHPGSGVVFDYGVYYITALVSLLGPAARVCSLVKAPYPTHRNILPESPEFGQLMDTPNESQVYALLEMKNGVCGTFQINADSVLTDQGLFSVYGTKGILHLGDANQFGCPVRLVPNSTDYWNPPKPESLPFENPYTDESRGLGMCDMVQAIAERRKARTDATLVCHVLDVLDAIIKSGETGQWVDVHSTCDRPAPFYIGAK